MEELGGKACSAAQSDHPVLQLQGEEQQGDHNAEPASQGGGGQFPGNEPPYPS